MKLVLFDIDGTLVNAGPSGVPSLVSAIKKLYGKTPVFDVNALAGRTDIYNFSYVYQAAFKKKPSAAQLEALKKEYLTLLKQEVGAKVKAKKYKEVKGADKFIKALSKYKDVKIALATGNFEEAAKIKLAPLGLDKYFITGGFGAKATDRVTLLTEAVKNAQKAFKTKFKADDIYVIGDTHIDVIAAKDLGFHNGVVLEGSLGDKDKLLRAAAEIEDKNFSDINLWLMWLDLKADPKGVEKGSYIMPASAIEHVFFSRTGIDEQRLKMFRIKKYEDLESGKLI